jgi:hypothetical protein
MAAETSPDPQAAQFLTTEHFALQGSRAATISDSNGRSSLFVSTLSSSLVALGFIGQASRMGETFLIFAFVLLPTLLFLGLVIFERLLQSAIEDTLYARGINRIRHFYLERAPATQPYFVLSDRDDNAGVMGNMGIERSNLQVLLTNAGMISVVNGVIAGVLVGLALHTALSFSTTLSAISGGVAALGLVFVQTRYQFGQWAKNDRRLTVMFPSDPESAVPTGTPVR